MWGLGLEAGTGARGAGREEGLGLVGPGSRVGLLLRTNWPIQPALSSLPESRSSESG